MHKSTALRLLRTLHEHGLVYRQPDQRYRLGARLFALAQQAMETLDVREIAHPHLVALNEACGHTVHLAVYEEGEVLYIDKVESRYPVRMYSRIGKPVAITVAAVAKLLLADLPEAERRAVAERLEYPAYTARSTPDAAAFLKELAGCANRAGPSTSAATRSRSTASPRPSGAPTAGSAAAMSVSAPNVVVRPRNCWRCCRWCCRTARRHQPRVQRSDTRHPPPRGEAAMSDKTAITPATHTAPPAKFSHGVRKGNILQVAGQVGFLPAVRRRAPDAGRPRHCASRRSRPSPTSRRCWRRAARAGTTW